jgi:hypothetical protein
MPSSFASHLARLCRAPLWALLLVCALLIAQQQGFEHRIAHAGWHGGDATALEAIDHDATHAPAATHHCAAYDAATLGHGPPSFGALPANALAQQRALPAPDVRPAASRCAAGFHARAPPRA